MWLYITKSAKEHENTDHAQALMSLEKEPKFNGLLERRDYV